MPRIFFAGCCRRRTSASVKIKGVKDKIYTVAKYRRRAFTFLTAVNISILIFLVATLCVIARKYQRYEQKYCLYFQH
jgi:hypothetical protein